PVHHLPARHFQFHRQILLHHRFPYPRRLHHQCRFPRCRRDLQLLPHHLFLYRCLRRCRFPHLGLFLCRFHPRRGLQLLPLHRHHRSHFHLRLSLLPTSSRRRPCRHSSSSLPRHLFLRRLHRRIPVRILRRPPVNFPPPGSAAAIYWGPQKCPVVCRRPHPA